MQKHYSLSANSLLYLLSESQAEKPGLKALICNKLIGLGAQCR